MKVLLVALSPSIGMQFYTAGLAGALVNAGQHAVWVVGSAVRRSEAFDPSVTLVAGHSFSGTGLSARALNSAGFRRLLHLVDDIEPTVVHLTGPHVWNWPLALCLRKRYPVLLTQHDATTHKGARGEWLKGVYRRAVLRSVDCLVVHSAAVEESLRNGGLLPPATSRMPLVHHNFDYGAYRRIRAEGAGGQCYENMALLFGRLEEYKGVRQFVEAAHLLTEETDADALQSRAGIKLVVAGAGRLAGLLDGPGRPLNLEVLNHVIDDRETIALFRRAGLVVLPYSEGSQSALIPLAYLFQKPVLVTRVGALPEYVRDGVTGRVVDSNEPQVLARAIREMLGDREALMRMGQEGHRYLLELEEKFVACLLDTYERAAGRAQR